jgi:hypothetical protein
MKIITGLREWLHRDAASRRNRAPLSRSKRLTLPGPLAAACDEIAAAGANLFSQYDSVLLDAEGGAAVEQETGRQWPAGKSIPIADALAVYQRMLVLLEQEGALCQRWLAGFDAVWHEAARALTLAEKEETGRRRALGEALGVANGEPLHPDRLTRVCRELPCFTRERDAASSAAARLGEQRAGVEARLRWIQTTLAAAATSGLLPWETD